MIEKDEPLTISQYTLKEMIRQTIFLSLLMRIIN